MLEPTDREAIQGTERPGFFGVCGGLDFGHKGYQVDCVPIGRK